MTWYELVGSPTVGICLRWTCLNKTNLLHLWLFFWLISGRNMLLVGVDGPKVPCEEILVKHLGNRLYNVSYQLKEKGEYILVVKWGDEHIPGSPYHITV